MKNNLFLVIILGFTFQYFSQSLALNSQVMTIDSLNVEEQEKSKPSTWSSMPFMFIKCLVEPFYEDGVEQLTKINKDGLKNYLYKNGSDFFCHIKNRFINEPMETLLDITTLSLMAGVDNGLINLGHFSAKLKKVCTNMFSNDKKGVPETLLLTMDICSSINAFNNIVSNIVIPEVHGFWCFEPPGEWIETCRPISVEKYKSTDRRLGQFCKLEASCTSLVPRAHPLRNIFYYSFERSPVIGAFNGTLTLNDEYVGLTKEHLSQKLKCTPYFREYDNCIRANVMPYLPDDKNLANIVICKQSYKCGGVNNIFEEEEYFFPH